MLNIQVIIHVKSAYLNTGNWGLAYYFFLNLGQVFKLKFGIQMQFDIGTFNHRTDNSSKNYMTELIKKVLQIQYNGDLNNGNI